MPRFAGLQRFAALFIAASLVHGPSFLFADADNLRRGQSHGAHFVALGAEADYDSSRFARHLYSSGSESGFAPAVITAASFYVRATVYAATASRKLYRLNRVFLI
jgi:hypothetical protein